MILYWRTAVRSHRLGLKQNGRTHWSTPTRHFIAEAGRLTRPELTRGEPADSTHILVSFVYKAAFVLYRYGYAAALSMVIFVILLTFGLLFLKKTRAAEADYYFRSGGCSIAVFWVCLFSLGSSLIEFPAINTREKAERSDHAIVVSFVRLRYCIGHVATRDNAIEPRIVARPRNSKCAVASFPRTERRNRST